jgi:hypothetical protein
MRRRKDSRTRKDGEGMAVDSRHTIKHFKDGEPCNHPGCQLHTTHHCEVCRRLAAKGEAKITVIEINPKASNRML